jgi:putative acetyltransferase
MLTNRAPTGIARGQYCRDNLFALFMRIRPFTADDLGPVVALYTETVHRISSRDYTPQQIAVWAPRDHDWNRWQNRFNGLHTLIAEHAGKMIGFTAFTEQGYVDFLFVHHEHQRQGIARALLTEVEAQLRARGVRRVTAHASITARPFFEAMGYVVLEQRWFEKDGVTLTNFAMDKDLATA